ncbi:DNA/RNA non-specific endonuclease, partial [Belnapia sp. T6]
VIVASTLHHQRRIRPRDSVQHQSALAAKTTELCFREYSVLYSGISRTPLAAAEHLTRERTEDARGLQWENAFHEEERLPPGQRAHLANYARSGFDRGHKELSRLNHRMLVPTSLYKAVYLPLTAGGGRLCRPKCPGNGVAHRLTD